MAGAKLIVLVMQRSGDLKRRGRAPRARDPRYVRKHEPRR